MPKSDCSIEWDSGSMERSVEHIWKQVERSIDSINAAAIRDAEQQLDLLSDILHKTE